MQLFNATHDERAVRILADMQDSMDEIFGLKKTLGNKRKFKDLRDIYGYYTGDTGGGGVFDPRNLPEEIRVSMAINSTTFPNALGNTLNRILSGGYNKINYSEQILISQRRPASHLHTATFVELGCWDDLPDVNPETSDYSDMPDLSEAKNTFEILQKGCVIPITRRVIINDDRDLLKTLMLKLGLVARKSHARYVWNMWINNGNCNDETAWFTSAHGNLGAVALSISAVEAAITALAGMTEPDPSTDLLGIDLTKPQFHLIVSPSAWANAVKINQTKYFYSSNDLASQDVNPCYKLFSERNERIATPPFLTGNDWGVIRDKEEVPIIEMQYLDGKEEPFIYQETDPMSDMAIKGDWFGLKCRHEYGGCISDFRGGYKSMP